MALENVIDEIISQAERNKQEIIERGKQEAKKILDEATNKAKQHEQQFEEETKRILEETRKMEISSLNISLNKMMLDAKKKILDEVYQHLLERINKLDSEKRREIIKKLVEHAKKELPNPKFVYCNEGDEKLVATIKDLKFGGVINAVGGVIVENADKNIRTNYTFDVLLNNLKEAYWNEIARRVFEEK